MQRQITDLKVDAKPVAVLNQAGQPVVLRFRNQRPFYQKRGLFSNQASAGSWFSAETADSVMLR
jgi:hypothetical protein